MSIIQRFHYIRYRLKQASHINNIIPHAKLGLQNLFIMTPQSCLVLGWCHWHWDCLAFSSSNTSGREWLSQELLVVNTWINSCQVLLKVDCAIVWHFGPPATHGQRLKEDIGTADIMLNERVWSHQVEVVEGSENMLEDNHSQNHHLSFLKSSS